jgi:hypothetical protein
MRIDHEAARQRNLHRLQPTYELAYRSKTAGQIRAIEFVLMLLMKEKSAN